MTYARAARALRDDVARQILAPKPRSLGKSAAEGPNDRLQADLIDFNVNTRGANKYGLIVSDVFTREAVTKALPDKKTETVSAAAREIIPKLVEEETNYVVSTDQGVEFNGLEGALPDPVVHRVKDPSDRNALAVVDRTIQTLKRDLASDVARHGGNWSEHLPDATLAYNRRPRPPRMWNTKNPPCSDCTRTMPKNSNTTCSSPGAGKRDWRRWGPSGPQPMRDEASSPNMEPPRMWHPTTAWWSGPPMAPRPY